MARRRLPKINPCKVRPERFHRMTEEQLMAVWVRLGMSAPARTKIVGLIKGLVSNLAAMKASSRVHVGDSAQRKRSMAVYRSIVRGIEGRLKQEQARSCDIYSTEKRAQHAYDTGRSEEATKLWKQARRLKKR